MMRLVPYVGVAAAINGVAACREVFNPRRAVRRIFPWWIGLTRNRRQAMQTIFPAAMPTACNSCRQRIQ
jgi:hypothetical protein